MVRLYKRFGAGRKEGERQGEKEQELSPRSCSFHDLLLFIRHYLIFLLQLFSKSRSHLGTNLSLYDPFGESLQSQTLRDTY